MRTFYIGITLFSLLIVAPFTAMMLDNDPPYVYDVTGSYLIPEKTQAGHQITVHWKFSKINRVCAGDVQRTIVDARSGARTTYDPVPVALMSTMTRSINDEYLDRTFALPSGIVPGPKIYRANAEYFCNWLQRFWRPLKVQTPDLFFEVLP